MVVCSLLVAKLFFVSVVLDITFIIQFVFIIASIYLLVNLWEKFVPDVEDREKQQTKILNISAIIFSVSVLIVTGAIIVISFYFLTKIILNT